MAYSVLSLFSGCGGLDLGFVQTGEFYIDLAFDNWLPAVQTYRANLGEEIQLKNLDLDKGEVCLDDLPHCDVVLGGPPCQGYSFAGKQFFDDPRNKLYQNFAAIVKATSPKAFLLENVLGMEAMALTDVETAFKAIGYKISSSRVLATDFGVAQKRERLLIVGFREDLGVVFERPLAAWGSLFGEPGECNILEAIGDLPEPIELVDISENLLEILVPLDLNSSSQRYLLDVSQKNLQKVEHALSQLPVLLQNHVYNPLPFSVQRFVRHIPNGGCFRDAPKELLPERLLDILGNPAKYRSPRLFPKPNPYEPAQTVPADTNPSIGGVLAPDLDYSSGQAKLLDKKRYTKKRVYTSPYPSRRFTPRESARLQSFPDKFHFEGSISAQYKQIGNAVPVRLAKAYAKQILKYLVDLDTQD